MNWSPQQDAALKAVDKWLKNPDQQIFRLFGYAGTGKTTLARHLSEGVKGRTLFGAYTGKAAYVMRSKGCNLASTIHQLIYLPSNKSRQKLREMEKILKEMIEKLGESHTKVKMARAEIGIEQDRVKQPAFVLNPDSPVTRASLVIIDECSMVGEQMAKDLMSFKKPILVLGDPAQLPPVKSAGYFTHSTRAKPDIMLTEIHRQARDNPIISLATKVRKGEPLRLGTYGESMVLPRGAPLKEYVMGSSQTLVGRNATRSAWNARFRELHGFRTPYPGLDDKLVCLRNNHDKGLLNGGMWTVKEIYETNDDRCRLKIAAEDDGTELDVACHSAIFRGDKVEFWEIGEAEHFDYGYALTCHKAQGSQWGDVFVMDESAAFRNARNQWLYTAITRASERVIVAKS